MQKIFLLNFTKTECENLSNELNLGAILSDLGLKEADLLEQKVSEFFSDEVYCALKECEFLNNEFNIEFNKNFVLNFNQKDRATEKEREVAA